MKTVAALFFIMLGPGLLTLGLLAGGMTMGSKTAVGVLAAMAALPPIVFALLWKKHIGLSYAWGLLVVPMGYMSLAFGVLGALEIYCTFTYCPPL